MVDAPPGDQPMSHPHTSKLARVRSIDTVRHQVRRSALVLGLRVALGLGLVGGLVGALVGAGTPAWAQGASLEGSWSGGGTVRFASGGEEQARCRAHYSRRSKSVYVLRATCATASGKAAQSATLQKVGNNRYSGTFYNSEYDISGRIYVVLRGSSQSVLLTSAGGSASIRLSR
jgi:hypothetical protein